MDNSEMFQWISYGDREYLDDYLLQYDIKISILVKSILKAPEMEAEVISVIHEIAYEGISSHQVLESEFPFWIIHEAKTIATVYRNVMSTQDFSIPFVSPISSTAFISSRTPSCNLEICPYLRDRDALAKKNATVTIMNELSSISGPASAEPERSLHESDSAKPDSPLHEQAPAKPDIPLHESAPTKPVEMSIETLTKDEEQILGDKLVEPVGNREGVYSTNHSFDYDYTDSKNASKKHVKEHEGFFKHRQRLTKPDDVISSNEVPRVSTLASQAISKESSTRKKESKALKKKSGSLERHPETQKGKFKLRLAPVLVGILIILVIALLICVVYGLLNAAGIFSLDDIKLSCFMIDIKLHHLISLK